MARNLFGGSSDDYAVDSTGRPIAVRRVRFYTSAAMTTEITDLASDAAGTGAPLTVNTDAHGFWGPVYGPDGVTTMYAGTVDSGGNPPAYVVAIYTHTSGGVASFNTRAGAVSLTKADVTATALAAADVGAPNVVVHGSTAGTARPAGATVVHWIGSIAPTNVTGNDEWTDTTNKLLKRWNGSAFDALGSAASPTVHAASAATGVAATDTPNIQAALDAANAAGGGTVYLPAGTFKINAALTIGSNTRLYGAGRGATILQLAADAVDVLTNKDYTNGNPNITIEHLSLFGDAANRTLSDTSYALHLERCARLTINDVEAHHFNGPGIFLTGNGTNTRETSLTSIYVHDNIRWGLWVGFRQRQCIFTNVYAYNNSQYGVVFDSSECIANGVYAYQNSMYGVWIRNVLSCNYGNISATENGRHGIFVEGALSCIGHGWNAHNNGTIGAGWSDVYLSAGNSAVPNYGPTQYLTLTGVSVGWETNLGTNGGVRTEDYSFYIEDTLSEVKVFALQHGGAGNLGDLRIPATLNNLVVVDTAAATAHLRMPAGDTFNKASFARLLGVATASRPAASAAGKGAQHYDTTLNKPIWSDGTNWKDAAGTVV